ncbi:origin recognition complex subunit 3 isoform X2 [Lycorma delicatula]|uniref:origin recognition complex subunit 3 isoform X2 n=1 Tax=Lycorma delicatula TaxID=130591 RepID=UPI003F50F502
MDSTVSVSKGCFVFKPKDEGKKGKRKKYHDVLDFSSTMWYKPYSNLWKIIETKLKKINKTVSDVVLHDIESYITECDTSTGSIPTAVLLMGVNLPDHNALLTSLALELQLQNNHVALLQSENCNSVKNIIEQTVAQFLKGTKIQDEEEMMDFDYDSSDSDEEKTNIKRSDCSLPHLLLWYNENKKNEKENSSHCSKLVIILKDFEGFSSVVLEDFILILSQYSKSLPIVLVMGVATTVSAVHRTLPHNVNSQLNMRLFQSKPSVYFLNNTLDNVFLKVDCPFQLGSRIFKFLTDVFLYYDFSVDGFIKGIKAELDDNIDSLNEDQLREFQKLSSFQSYIHKKSKQKQTKNFSSKSVMKEELKKLMRELWLRVSDFHLLVRLLQILVGDLPNAPLGKQIREIYSEAVSVKITNNSGYNECFKILGFTAKNELLNKLKKMTKVLEETSCKSERIKTIEKKLKEFCVIIEMVGFGPVNNTPTKSPSKEKFNVTSRAQFRERLEKMSQSNKPKNEYEATRGEFLNYLKDEVFDKTLVPITSVPLHEVILFDDISSIKSRIIGTPRAAVHTALNNPHHYLQCDCCKLTNDGEILSTMPDICIAYKLHLESGSLINMFDWLQSFATVIDPENVQKSDRREISSHIQARFTQAVAELQFLGFIKSSKKKTDHVSRLTWGGSV